LEVITAVTIDAHGVLLLPDPDAIRNVLEEFSCEPSDETCSKAHYEMVRLLDQMTNPDWPTMNSSFAQALGVRASVRDDAGSVLAKKVYLGTSWIPAPGAAGALARLVDGGYGAAVVSNTVHGELAETLARVQLCALSGELVRVAAIVDSSVIGIEKPDPRPFLLALEALGVNPSNCVHVGDSLHSDVVGAIGVGMSAFHVDPLRLCTDLGHEHAESFEVFVAELLRGAELHEL
jgi:putative hydrolase of the HAD superfamily